MTGWAVELFVARDDAAVKERWQGLIWRTVRLDSGLGPAALLFLHDRRQ